MTTEIDYNDEHNLTLAIEAAKQFKIQGDNNELIAYKLCVTVERVRALLDKVVWDDPKPAEDYWAQFVPQYYQMDPETDELLMGDRLKNGMVVLIESDDFRANVSMLQKYGAVGGLASAKKYNRWATVSNFQILDNGDISFFAVYQDDTKKQLRHSAGFAWYVKLDSIPEEDPLSQEEQELKEAMAALTETAKHAWSDLVTMLRDSFKSEQEQMDKARAKLRDHSDLKFSKKPENLGEDLLGKVDGLLAQADHNDPDHIGR